MDRGLHARTTFRNVYSVGHWIQCNILGVDHTTLFNKPVFHIIHNLITPQNNVCLCTILLQQLVANSQRTRGSKYSLPILVTRLCRAFLPDKEFSSYDSVCDTGEDHRAYNSCLHLVWTPTVLFEDVPIESTSEEQMDEENEPEFWCKPPPTESHALMSSIQKGMKTIFRGQIILRK